MTIRVRNRRGATRRAARNSRRIASRASGGNIRLMKGMHRQCCSEYILIELVDHGDYE